ncbi:MAG TPA: thiamine-phosphate kinase [Longimicrobium sp.]|jgi:thiamine-monophosphate kinase|uniref:thiamine-phosphate kinase n=1 Tax=Longimicrobium sp. TaxID=2029185 RepID=UPI002ED771CF
MRDSRSSAGRTAAAPLGPGPEFDLIRGFLAGGSAVRADVRVGPGDDCAVVAGDGIALSTDMSVEGIHFRRDWLSAEEIGWRAAAAALSDLAAVAARPVGILVSIAVPADEVATLAPALMSGCREAVEAVGGALLGGDLTRSPGPLVIDVTVVGEAPRPVLRSGARLGDEVWVTGLLGGAAAYVQAMLAGQAPRRGARERFARPRPRLREARWLADRVGPTAMIDLSDGLAGDAAHLAAASGLALLLVPELLPVHPAARTRSRPRTVHAALTGGEDYELCITAPAGAVAPHAEAFHAAFGLPLTCVGRTGGGDGVWWVDAEGHRTPVNAGGYQHFREGP